MKKYIQFFVKDLGKNIYIEKLTAFTNYVFNNNTEDLENLIKDDLSDLNTRKIIMASYKVIFEKYGIFRNKEKFRSILKS